MMSEAEAKQKWCPQARIAYGKFTSDGTRWHLYDHQTASNAVFRNAADDGKTKSDTFRSKCIGSECMAWRWAEKSALEVPMVGDVMDRKGYCGAYGKPDYGDRDE